MYELLIIKWLCNYEENFSWLFKHISMLVLYGSESSGSANRRKKERFNT